MVSVNVLWANFSAINFNTFFIIFRYQKKIGTYDKQQWEKTVEQRILSGFTSVPLKNTKLRTEFIDVDLVRGMNTHAIVVLKLKTIYWITKRVRARAHFVVLCGNRFDISESETEAKFVDRTTIGIHTFCILAGVCKMVGGTNIAKDICIFSDIVCAANVQLGRLQLQCAP